MFIFFSSVYSRFFKLSSLYLVSIKRFIRRYYDIFVPGFNFLKTKQTANTINMKAIEFLNLMTSLKKNDRKQRIQQQSYYILYHL